MPKSTKLNAAATLQSLDALEQDSFRISPVPALILLPKGFQLYKWTGTSRHDRATGQRIRNSLFDQNGFASQFWAPWAAMHQYQVPGFADIRKRDRNIGGSVGRPQELARAHFAVTEEWSEMNSLIKAELLTPMWAFLGVCSEKPLSDNPHDHRHGVFPGGNYQLVIPGLAAPDIFKL